MSAVRAVASADSWSLSTGFKEYFACCFSKSEPAAADDAKARGAGPAAAGSRRSSAASSYGGADDHGRSKMVDRRPEADGASVHSTGTDKATAASGHMQAAGDGQ